MDDDSAKLEPLPYIAGSVPAGKDSIWFGYDYGLRPDRTEVKVNGRRLLPTEYTISEDGIITLLTFCNDTCECEQCQ